MGGETTAAGKTTPGGLGGALARVMPLGLSGMLFVSVFFAVVSPLPISYLRLNLGRAHALAGVVLSGCLAWLLSSATGAFAYLIFAAAPGLALAELLARTKSIEKAAIGAMVSILLAGSLALGVWSVARKAGPAGAITGIRSEIRESVEQVWGRLGPEIRSQLEVSGPGELERQVIAEVPSAMGILALVLSWVNVVLLIRLNPGRIRERIGVDRQVLAHWKAPEWLVWPTIAAGALVLLDVDRYLGWRFFGWRYFGWSVGVLKFLLAIYAIQGLSILSFFFDLWGLKGVFRSLAYALAVFMMLPLVLALGFFDLWFDFRAKFKQT